MLALSISTWYETLSYTEQIFWVIALTSSGLFFIQVFIALLGFEADGDAFIETDGLDGGFSLISFRTILSFLVCFGWIGIVVLRGGGTLMSAIIWASLAGISAMMIVAYMLYQLAKMDESGTVDLAEAIGKEGVVYLRIPAQGLGKISIEISGKIMELHAKSTSGEVLTGSKIKVLDLQDENIMLVTAI